MNKIPIIDQKRFLDYRRGAKTPYYAFYSSLAGGIVTEPHLMLMPMDDHMAHRGDGVFEAFKCVRGALYNLPAHWDRLWASAAFLSLTIPFTRAELTEIVIQTIRAGQHADCLVRLFISRGPGSMGISPYDCPTPAVYVMAYELKPSFMDLHADGARAQSSRIPAKHPPFANIKSVNYLPNALMKMEAADAGVDFTLSFDEHGCLAEGATENAGIVSQDGRLLVPQPTHILAGTTMNRALQLAATLVTSGELTAVAAEDIRRGDIIRARELLIFGTTPDVTAVIELDGQAVGPGKAGPIYARLNALLVKDIDTNTALRTVVKWD